MKKLMSAFLGSNQINLGSKLTEGELFANDDEAVADSSLKEEYDIKIGDTVKLSGNEKKLKIVGFTENARFQCRTCSLHDRLVPIKKFALKQKIPAIKPRINAIVTRNS